MTEYITKEEHEKILADVEAKNAQDIDTINHKNTMAQERAKIESEAQLQKTSATLEKKISELNQKLAVSEALLGTFKEFANVNADIVDIKELIATLIAKIPSVTISGGLVPNAGGQKDQNQQKKKED